jgi:hypothetical protein
MYASGNPDFPRRPSGKDLAGLQCYGVARMPTKRTRLEVPHRDDLLSLVHELAHLRGRGHGRSFWRLVAEVLPEYPIAKQWLKREGGGWSEEQRDKGTE